MKLSPLDCKHSPLGWTQRKGKRVCVLYVQLVIRPLLVWKGGRGGGDSSRLLFAQDCRHLAWLTSPECPLIWISFLLPLLSQTGTCENVCLPRKKVILCHFVFFGNKYNFRVGNLSMTIVCLCIFPSLPPSPLGGGDPHVILLSLFCPRAGIAKIKNTPPPFPYSRVQLWLMQVEEEVENSTARSLYFAGNETRKKSPKPTRFSVLW